MAIIVITVIIAVMPTIAILAMLATIAIMRIHAIIPIVAMIVGSRGASANSLVNAYELTSEEITSRILRKSQGISKQFMSKS